MDDRRERCLRDGVETLSDSDLLALVLGARRPGRQTPDPAFGLLDLAGSLTELCRHTARGLEELPGMGAARAARLAAAFELGRRGQQRTLGEEGQRIRGQAEVVAWARPRLSHLEHEEVWLLVLDGRNAVRSVRRIAQGGLHGCALTTRDVLSPALRDAASAIVLVHNHPSGDPRPSVEDVSMTRAIAAACEVVGLVLLDHVIVARGGSSSLLEHGSPSHP